jgi:hypothetical protein
VVLNRKKKKKSAFETIRIILTSRLYLVSDGPKGVSREELAKCGEIRFFNTEIDWDLQFDHILNRIKL